MSATIPLSVEVNLSVEPGHPLPGTRTDDAAIDPERYEVKTAQWRVHGDGDYCYVGLALFTASYKNVTINAEVGVPEWTPAAPAWFTAVVEQMRAAVAS